MTTVTVPRTENARAQVPTGKKGLGKGGPKGRRVNLPLLAAAILLIVGSAVVIGWVFTVSGNRTSVLVTAKDIPAGHVINEQDLGEAQIAGSGLSAIRASDRASMLGKIANGPLPAGTLLESGMMAAKPLPVTGQTALGLALKPGQMPPEVTSGRSVDVVLLPAQGGATDSKLLVHNATVMAVNATNGGGWTVTVSVPGESSLDVAGAAAVGRVGLVLLPLGAG